MGVLGVRLRRLGLNGSDPRAGRFHGSGCSGDGFVSSGNDFECFGSGATPNGLEMDLGIPG